MGTVCIPNCSYFLLFVLPIFFRTFVRLFIRIPYYSYGVLFVFHNIPQMYYWYSLLIEHLFVFSPIGYCLGYEVFLLITVGDTKDSY